MTVTEPGVPAEAPIPTGGILLAPQENRRANHPADTKWCLG